MAPYSPAVAGKTATMFGVPMKQISLVTLTFQNTALIMLTHYSRTMPLTSNHRYYTSTAVFLAEVLKLAISLTFAIYEASRTLAHNTSATALLQQVATTIFAGDGWKLAILATLYTLENSLQYIALGNLDIVHFQILYQLKILTTAAFSVFLLGRSLSLKRWLALVLLTFGVSVVCLPSSSADLAQVIHDTSDHYFPRSKHELGQAGGMSDVAVELSKRALGALEGLAKRSATYEGIHEDLSSAPAMNYKMGVTAVLVAAAVSGLAGVYFEKLLKTAPVPVSVWTRNVQLSLYSLLPAFVFGVLLKDGDGIGQHGFFEGYNWVVCLVVVLQAVGGLLVSLCISYADNIAKNFATSLSLVIGLLSSLWFLGLQSSLHFLIGTALVLFSVFLYSEGDGKRARPPPISIISFEKTTIDKTPKSTADPSKHLLDPFLAVSTSRPSSPMLHHSRVPSSRGKRMDD